MSGTREVGEIAEEIRALVEELAGSGDPAAFGHLLGLQEHLGLGLATAARALADASSWAGVADQAGTTRQAAWARWH
ncbi:MAG: hypothetical protein V9F00_12300 [Nocardioides sp.]|jgi:hypothetical protein